ncbi:hypothetical protein GOV09_00015 [Candidatus Woesearchaeota archaeon]|nr:hypothetical protein [Candidatus Woesearchaeota archaeon]
MVKKCFKCGRPIRTGRKYCFEHRRTSNGSYVSKMDRLDRRYLRTKMNPVHIYVLLGVLVVLMVYGFIRRDNASFVDYFVAAFIIFISSLAVDEYFRFRVKNQIRNKMPEYVSFAKAYAGAHKREQEFRKSIWK